MITAKKETYCGKVHGYFLGLNNLPTLHYNIRESKYTMNQSHPTLVDRYHNAMHEKYLHVLLLKIFWWIVAPRGLYSW